MAEKYNLPGHHYQPAMFGEARKRILMGENYPQTVGGTKLNIRDASESERALELKRMYEKGGEFDENLEDVNLENEPLLRSEDRLAVEGRQSVEEISLKDPRRSITGERNAKFIKENMRAQFKQEIRAGEQAVQRVYRTRGDPVSAIGVEGLESIGRKGIGANPRWKVKVINSTLEHHDNLGNIHYHSNFDPPPVTDAGLLERSALKGAEVKAGSVLVARTTTATAVKGIAKGALEIAGVGMAVYDTYNNFSDFMNDPTKSKADKATLGTLEISKQASSFALGAYAGSSAGAATAAALAGLAPAIAASGGAVLVGLIVGAGITVGVTMLGDLAKQHYKDIEHGAETVGKGFETAGKAVGKGVVTAGKTVGKGFKAVGGAIGGLFHHKKTKIIDADPAKVARYRALIAKGDKVGAMRMVLRDGFQKDKATKKQVDPEVAKANRRQAVRTLRKAFKKRGF